MVDNVPTNNHVEESDLFREEFKRYKRKNQPLMLDNVINFSNTSSDKVTRFHLQESTRPELSCLKSPNEWKVFQIEGFRGFYFILNPFRQGYQRYWVRQCIEYYPCKPNVTNLDAHGIKFSASHSILGGPSGKDIDSKTVDTLRWATLGYHYNWDTKKYYMEDYSPYPKDLTCLTQYVATVLGFDSFKAESSIINYYYGNSTLGGHTDHSEFDKEAPLFSISFGQPAIFLLGGKTKAIRPVAMYINSGDVIIMSGKTRLAYHAVPKIVSTSEVPSCFDVNDKSKIEGDTTDTQTYTSTSQATFSKCVNCVTNTEIKHHSTENTMEYINDLNKHMDETIRTLEWDPYARWLARCRINMNVRQVLETGKEFPDN